MARIFICYRRDDASGYAGRLYDRLREQFSDEVFMDIDGIGPGDDYVELIDETIGSIEVVLVMIGRNWLDARDNSGRRRLEIPQDLVREEISQALSRNVLVIPVLVQDARLPTADELPPDLSSLARRNAIELSDERWNFDTDRLCDALDEALRYEPESTENRWGDEQSEASKPRQYPATPQKFHSLFKRFALIGIGAVAVASLVFFLTAKGERPGESFELTMEVENGVLEPPMVVGEDSAASGGRYVLSTIREQGAVVLGPFEVPSGRYVIETCALPLGSNPAGSDSAFVRIDDGTTRFLWDFFEDAPGLPSNWSCELVSARCGGAFDTHRCDPLYFEWEAGSHTITLETLEADFGLDVITVRSYSG